MKQILQNLSNGETTLVEVPCPQITNGSILIASRQSLVSAGTERMLVDFGKAGYLEKARKQPEKVKQVLDKIKTDGLFPTIDAVRSKLDQPIPLGYSNAGVVIESDLDGFSVGDRVVSNGYHAEVVRANKNLCARIPDEVDDETAAFTVLAAIGLQGIRLIKPTLGETIAVSGLGLIGLLCVQMLRASGCRVLGIDFDSHRCELAREFGAETANLSTGEDPIAVANMYSRGNGVDGVLIAASSKSDEVLHQAAEICRKRGRIVLIGVVGLNMRRDDFFKKEITFQISASYGPGRYDPLYEEKGQDYPLGFVRWTEQRNFEAVLDMMAAGTLNVKKLISHRFSVDEALQAYRLLGNSSALGILIEYPAETGVQTESLRSRTTRLLPPSQASIKSAKSALPVVGFIGAGNYASRVLIPAFKAAGAQLETLVTTGGINSVHHGGKAGFATASTSLEAVWDNPDINTVVIATRHDSHASLISDAIKAGKHVFVEKPLCLTLDQLSDIDTTYRDSNKLAATDPSAPDADTGQLLMVGFNRRFAPHVKKMKELVSARHEPKSIIITVNAGEIPPDHWAQDAQTGGGRIIGEGCHYVDLMRFLVDSPITGHQVTAIGDVPGIQVRDDKVAITLTFADGSFGTIHYLANGGKAFPKERVEVFCGNAVLQLDNYRVLRSFGWRGFRAMKLWRQDKGQQACAHVFCNAIKEGRHAPIPYAEILEVSQVSIELAKALR